MKQLHLNESHSTGEVGVILASLASLVVASWLDWATGHDFLCVVFYLVPVWISAWYMCQTTTLAVAGLSGVCWLFFGWLGGYHHADQFPRHWHEFTCFLAFALLGLVVNGLRRSVRELPEVTRSQQEVRNLQSQPQVVCAWTKRIKVDDAWIPLDEFMASRLNVEITHGISPEAFEKVSQEASQCARCEHSRRKQECA